MLYFFTLFSAVAHRCKTVFRNWLCGTVDEAKKYLSPEEKAEIRQKMTSLKINSKWRKVLNVLAVALATLTTFLLGYFG